MSDRSVLPLLGTDPTLGELFSARRALGSAISARLYRASRSEEAAEALREEIAGWDYFAVAAAAAELGSKPDASAWWHEWRGALVAELEARRAGATPSPGGEGWLW